MFWALPFEGLDHLPLLDTADILWELLHLAQVPREAVVSLGPVHYMASVRLQWILLNFIYLQSLAWRIVSKCVEACSLVWDVPAMSAPEPEDSD